MQRDEVIARLRHAEPDIRALGADGLFLFGSVARDEATASSDIDLFVDPDPIRTFGYDDFMNVHEFLQACIGPKASMTTREGLHGALRSRIEATAIRIF